MAALALIGALVLAPGFAAAQRLPPIQGPGTIPDLPRTPPLGGILGGIERTRQDRLDDTTRLLDTAREGVRALEEERIARLRDLVRAHPEALEMTRLGPAVRGQVLAIDADSAALAAAAEAGFAILEQEAIEGLDLRTAILAVPRGMSVERALRRLRRIAPRIEFAANHLHVQSGAAGAAGGALAQGGGAGGAAVGIIDGGVAAHPAIRGPVRQRGFARGAPRPSGHATAIASLIAGSGMVRGVAPGTTLIVADVYGADPAGGNALALARALGWMAAQRVSVVAVSLVGPPNPLVARAVAQARGRGLHIVAAVGNDGPAAPPAYPASYPGVIAVTGVDARNRPLPEAGRALHLDYAAPGADMAAATENGRLGAVRGTSYAVPFVAGRLVRQLSGGGIAALDAEVDPRGGRGRGRGVICGDCRTPIGNARASRD
ncbi:MAG: S8 family serine peptidase [Alphaproteobacteria bacterium]